MPASQAAHRISQGRPSRQEQAQQQEKRGKSQDHRLQTLNAQTQVRQQINGQRQPSRDREGLGRAEMQGINHQQRRENRYGMKTQPDRQQAVFEYRHGRQARRMTAQTNKGHEREIQQQGNRSKPEGHGSNFR